MAITITPPAQTDVDALRDLLDLMVDFPDNDQRARYLLSSNWMRDKLSLSDDRLMAALRGRLIGTGVAA